MSKTSIEWTDMVWNPVTGCTKVSSGCKNCYAERMHTRFSDQPFSEVALHPDRLDQPLHWRKPRRIFVCSMSDLFHSDVPGKFIADVFWTMTRATEHTFQVLTKRPGRMKTFVEDCYLRGQDPKILPANIWLGVSVENQKTADERIVQLLRTPAAVRFVSYEPTLGPVDFTRLYGGICIDGAVDVAVDGIRGLYAAAWKGRETRIFATDSKCNRIDWLICGGESGPKARPCDLTWIRSVIQQCGAASVPCFVKQLGTRPQYHTCRNPRCTHPDCGFADLDLKDYKGGNPDEWPEDLRVREFPEVK